MHSPNFISPLKPLRTYYKIGYISLTLVLETRGGSHCVAFGRAVTGFSEKLFIISITLQKVFRKALGKLEIKHYICISEIHIAMCKHMSSFSRPVVRLAGFFLRYIRLRNRSIGQSVNRSVYFSSSVTIRK